MKPSELKLIKEVRKDCLTLKERHELTEFGLGQLMLCEVLLKTNGGTENGNENN